MGFSVECGCGGGVVFIPSELWGVEGGRKLKKKVKEQTKTGEAKRKKEKSRR